VAGVAENQFVLGASALIPWVEAQLDFRGIYVDEIYDSLPSPNRPDEEVDTTSDYFTLNARLSKDIGENFSAYIECENLFDKDYESEIGFPGPGRNFVVGVKASF
jgi:outer membrane receptor protein involved in Fe transport